jgi:Mce-associated membrane protein
MKTKSKPSLGDKSQTHPDDYETTTINADTPANAEAGEEDSPETVADDVNSAESSEETGAEDQEPTGTSSTAQPTKSPDVGAARPSWASRAIRGAAAAVLICAVAGAACEAWLIVHQHQKANTAHQALTAATTFVNKLTTVDTNAIDKDFGDVLGGSTGEFKDLYTKSSAQLRRVLVDNKAAAHGTVVEAAVESATMDRVVVLLFVDQSVSNQQAPDPQIDRSRVKITMEKVDRRWLASKVEMP